MLKGIATLLAMGLVKLFELMIWIFQLLIQLFSWVGERTR